MTEKEIDQALREKYAHPPTREQIRQRRKWKFRRYYQAERLDVEIRDTIEKLAILEEIRSERS